MTNLTILYATDDMTSRLHATHAARHWEIFCPTSINEALAMAVYYAPHAVVIDGDSEWLNELTLNLTSVTGPSPRMNDIIVRLADTPLDAYVPEYVTYLELAFETSPDELARVLSALDLQRERDARSTICFDTVA